MLDLNPVTVDTLKGRIAARRQEWRETQDEFMEPAYRDVGNHLRVLQNAGLSITQLATYWGTTNRNTIYKFLGYANMPLIKTEKEKRLKAKEAPKTENLAEYVYQEPTENPSHIKVRTLAPVPVEAWPENINPSLNWPTEPWEGEAEWDDSGILMTPRGMPLHLAQKTLGGIDKLLAGV